jgi:hypothetical protein
MPILFGSRQNRPSNSPAYEARIAAEAAAAQAAAQEEALRLRDAEAAKFEAEKAAQQAVMAKAEQDYAAAVKQAEESQIQAKRISAVADYQGQQLTQQARQTSALAMQSQVQPLQPKKKTQIGQPGISRTRVSSGIGIGGYGGTSAGNVNPTGLNI